MSTNVWFITGCSTGFGRAIAFAALAHGDKVIATGLHTPSLSDLQAKGATTLALDITWNDQQVQNVVQHAVNIHGRIDILVNNGGILIMGAIEEFSAEEVNKHFSVNVFGTLRVIRAVLPYMRKQQNGIIANIGSLTAWFGPPLTGIYAATKHAVAGLSLALREEVKGYGVDVTVIEPGVFPTQLIRSHYKSVGNPLAELKNFTTPTAAIYEAMKGAEPNDIVKGAQVIVDFLTKSGICSNRKADERLPSRLLLGSDAVKRVRDVLAESNQRVEEWVEVSAATDVAP